MPPEPGNAVAVALRHGSPPTLLVRTSPDAVRGHAAHLLAWMALHPGRAWSVDDLARRLWSDGPPPTGERYCMNSVSMRFVAEGDPLPDELGRGAPEGELAG